MAKREVKHYDYLISGCINLPEGNEVTFDQSSVPPTTLVDRIYKQYPDCTSISLAIIRRELPI